MAVSERTREKLNHINTVAQQLGSDEVYVGVIVIPHEVLDHVCCNMHRLLVVQELMAEATNSAINCYLIERAKRDNEQA